MVHPEPARLSDFARGLLAPELADEVERHLAECPACCERAASAGKDGFIACLQSAAAGDTQPSLVQPTVADPVSAIPPALREHPRYRVVRLLGRGGMGEVYLAEHRVMQRLVALKVIRQDLVNTPELAGRFRREVLAAARLSHPNVVAALDAEQADELHFLVMEYVEGASLAAQVRDQGPLPVHEACEAIRQAALALQHAHEQGLVHRDIKPENLLRDAAGRVKVADFGLARLLRGEELAGTTTSAGILVGTVDYIAPEQANDSSKADIRADIYSLGCSLYHLLAGQAPYPGGGVLDKLARHMGGRPMRLAQLRPDVPAGLARVVDRMMSPEPARRHGAPAEVAQALAPFCMEQAPTPPASRWPWVAGGLLALALLVAGAAVYTFRTAKGTVEVRTKDSDVTVVVKKNGESVAIVDEKTGRTVELLPGEYDLVLIDNGKRLELSTDRVNVTRWGKAIVEVHFKKDKVVTKPAEKKQEKPKPKPTTEKPVAWPKDLAEVMKGAPDIEDDFSDPRKSTFDERLGRKKQVLAADLGIQGEYAGGLNFLFGPNKEESRHMAIFPEEGPAQHYLCVARGSVPSKGRAAWGFMIVGKDSRLAFAVMLWNDGMVQVTPRAEPPPGADVPEVKRSPVAAAHKGDRPNDLAVLFQGGKMRVFVNGREAISPVTLPAKLNAPSVPGIVAYISSTGSARVKFHDFRRWNLDRTALPAELAEVMKGKPDIDDDFMDREKSPFDPLRGSGSGKIEDKERAIVVSIDKGMWFRFGKSEKLGRQAKWPYDYKQRPAIREFVCRAVGQVESDIGACWGIYLQGKGRNEQLVVKLWNGGIVEVGPWFPEGGVAVPGAKKAHAAIRKNREKNELVVWVRAGTLRVFVNGAEVLPPRQLPKELGLTIQGLYCSHAGQNKAYGVVERFTRWNLAPPDVVETKVVAPADLLKLQPDIDDDFKDAKSSPFDPSRGKTPRYEFKKFRTAMDYTKDGYVMEFEKGDLTPRIVSGGHEDGRVREFGCRVLGEITSNEAASWGVLLQGGPGVALCVHVQNAGSVEVGPSSILASGDFKGPKLKATAHKAIKKGAKQNELVVIVQGRQMRLYVNGEEVAKPIGLPPELDEAEVGLFAYHTGQQEAKAVFRRFTLWRLRKEGKEEAAPPLPKEALSHDDVVKRKADIDDDFMDAKSSPFDPSRGKNPRWVSRRYKTATDYTKDGFVMEFERHDITPRLLYAIQDEKMAGDFACRVVGKVKSDEGVGWGLLLRGQDGEDVVVQMWNTGRIEVGPSRSNSADFDGPRLRPTAHKAIKEGEKPNELLVVVRGRWMWLYVNGESVAKPLLLPKGVGLTQQGLYGTHSGQEAAKIVFRRFTLWRLKGE